LIHREGNQITVSDRLTLDNAKRAASALFDSGVPIVSGEKLVVNLSRVEAVDSSAVSVLLQWSRLAREKGVQLTFINLPPNLRSLANLYDVDEVLSIS
jgi:phospholipid transport system transporter-binding protein